MRYVHVKVGLCVSGGFHDVAPLYISSVYRDGLYYLKPRAAKRMATHCCGIADCACEWASKVTIKAPDGTILRPMYYDDVGLPYVLRRDI
jgi:hypothetical protein